MYSYWKELHEVTNGSANQAAEMEVDWAYI